MKKEMSVRAGVVLHLTLIAVASLSLLAIFALKVIEITVERRHAEAAVSVAEVVRNAVLSAERRQGGDAPVAPGSPSDLSPYIQEVAILPEDEGPYPVTVTPVRGKAPLLFSVHPTVDVVLPLERESDASGEREGGTEGASRGRAIRVRFFSPAVEREARNLVKVAVVLVAGDIGVFVLFGFLLMDRSVVRPLRRLAAVSEKIASGDLGLRAEESRGNEVGQLGASFNRMVEGILSAQEKARRAQQETFRSENLATVGRLAAGVAHEVGNPLMGIRGYAEYLRKSHPSPGERDECLDKIVTETRKIENIVRGLLSVASPERDPGETADVNEVVRETVEMLSFRRMFGGVKVSFESGGVGRADISMERLRQVLLNLLINAVDAMEGGGELLVRTFGVTPWIPPSRRGVRRRASDPPDADVVRMRGGASDLPEGGVAVSITDTGCGIATDRLHAIFDPFYTTKDPGKGTGLGLSVSRAIVEAAGGEITVESAEGKGSTFTVILPGAGEDAPAGGTDGGTDG